MTVEVSDHYKERYRQRIARTKRIEYFANKALEEGRKIEELKDSRVRKVIDRKRRIHPGDYEYRVHNNYLHVFDPERRVAITVYNIHSTLNNPFGEKGQIASESNR